MVLPKYRVEDVGGYSDVGSKGIVQLGKPYTTASTTLEFFIRHNGAWLSPAGLSDWRALSVRQTRSCWQNPRENGPLGKLVCPEPASQEDSHVMDAGEGRRGLPRATLMDYSSILISRQNRETVYNIFKLQLNPQGINFPLIRYLTFAPKIA